MIRRAQDKDMDRINDLLSQVLEIHAKIRPDIFIPGTRKYTSDELKEIIHDDNTPIYVYTDENDVLLRYAFCIIKQPAFSTNMKPNITLFIDDLCVDEHARGQSVGRKLFEYVKQQAQLLGCHNITLNVWEGNDSARRFYERCGFGIQETVMEIIL